MKLRRAAITAALLGVLGAAPALPAQAPPNQVQPPRSFTVSRAASPIKIDGLLDEPAWATATLIELDNEYFPGENTSPPVQTRCFVTFDGDNLYVAFRADDPAPDGLRAHLADRDSAQSDDTVGFMIDTFNDRRRAFQFRVNPLGAQMEAANSDVDGSEDWSWDAIWESRGRIRQGGYDVEVRIPFSSLRFPRGAEASQTWGFLAMRDYPRSTRHRIRSTWTDRNKSCLICQFDSLTGFEGISPGRNLELDPTVTSYRTDERVDETPNDPIPQGQLEKGDLHAEAGLTARWGITPNVTANAAINPDFSQVEADAAQLSINTRFALFFPEKRPFFLEGADLFGTPLQAVFTRTIVNPTAGLKVTGKEGASAFGIFLAQDDVPNEFDNLIIPSNRRSTSDRTDPKVTTGVVRYRRDVGRTSTLGVLYTDREAGGYSNRLGGLDGTSRLTDSDTVRWQYLFTTTRYPDEVALRNGQPSHPFKGDGFSVEYGHETRDWFWFSRVQSLDPGFRADAGFIPRVDTRSASAGLNRTLWGKPGSWYNQLGIFLGADRTEDHERELSDEGVDLNFSYSGPLQTYLELGVSQNRDEWDGVLYNNTRQFVFLGMRPTGSFGLNISARSGETIDYDNSRQARFVTVSPGIDFSFGRHVRGTLSHTRQRLKVDEGDLFSVKLTQTTLHYHLNLRTFFRLILQYTDVDLNPELYAPEEPPRESEHLLAQFLFSYKVNPQTIILLGYSENREAIDPTVTDPMDPTPPGAIGLTRTDRVFFLKLGYAWVK